MGRTLMGSKKLKSVHITNYYHKTSGGISTVYNRLLEEANRHEREARLIVPGAEDRQEDVGKFGRIYYVKAFQSPIFDRRYRLFLPWQYLSAKSSIRRILEDEQPDLIEIADKYTLSFLAGFIKKGNFKSLNRPMLVHLSCERMDDNLRAFVSGSKPSRWLAKKVMGNYVAPMFDYHFANSVYTAQEILDAVPNGDHGQTNANLCWRFFRATKTDFSDSVFVSNCGVDDKLFSAERKNPETRAALLKEAGVPNEATVLLYAGRISPEKNVKLLYELIRALVQFKNHDAAKRNYQLLIAGDGPQTDWLSAKLREETPDNFKLLGHLGEKEKLADLYANADIFVHPNPREPFGIGPLEAMVSGTPVIAPNSGGVLSYATDQNAWITDADSESFFAAVMDILNNPEKRAGKIEKALETAERFTWQKSFDRCFRLYDELFEKFRREQNTIEFQRTRVHAEAAETLKT